MQLYTKILVGMAVGIVLGFIAGPSSILLPATGVDLSTKASVFESPAGPRVREAALLKTAHILEEKKGSSEGTWLKISWRLSASDVLKLKKRGIEVTAGNEHRGWVLDETTKVRRFAPTGRALVKYTEWVGRLFLALIKMVVVPLVFFSLIVGISSLGDFRTLGRLGTRTIALFLGTTVIALVIGIGLTNLLKPGQFLSDSDRAALLTSYEGAAGQTVANAAETPNFIDQIVSIVPTNPLKALADGEMLQVIFFALMFGMALTLMKGDRAKLIVDVCTRLNEAMVVLVQVAMRLAPYGVAALLFKVVGSTGFSVLVALAVYGLVVLLGLIIHVLLTYGTLIRFFLRRPFFSFLGAIKEPLLVAFSTSSSSAALPVTMKACEDNLRVSKKVTSFVLPLGATINMDGTALYQAVSAVFIAQIYGMDLSIGDQTSIVVSATLASIGTAGVPGAGLITLAMVLTTIGVPAEGLALILGIERLLDMFRTVANVVGDSTVTALAAHFEGEALSRTRETLRSTA